MKYETNIILNGNLYKAGDEVPLDQANANQNDETQKLISKVKRMSKPDLISTGIGLAIEFEETLGADAMKEQIIAKIIENAEEQQ